MMKLFGRVNGKVKYFFSHGTKHSKGVCILIDPSLNYVLESSHASKSGRIVMITVLVNGLKISFCNIYAPNNLQEQLEFIQELNNCLIDKAQADSLVLGGDWNCTLSKKIKRVKCHGNLHNLGICR